MEKKSKQIILLSLLAIAFAYRFSLLTMNTYPPGADIGLHESIIKSITSGNTNFFYNNYQMGGGFSITNPGYHIFAAFMIAMTGAPDYLAQAFIACFFSALLVLCAFYITQKVWNETAAFIVAILAIFSASDIVILAWSGYPNVITLTLIPLTFYLFLKHSELPTKSYLLITSIITSALFLTHIFSAYVFLAIIAATLLLSLLFKKRTALKTKDALFWILPIILGALLVSPYLIKAAPIYFSPESSIIGAVSAIKQAVLETRLISIGTIIASIIPASLFFIYSKNKYGKFISAPSILFAAWIIIPAAATQSYLAGVYLDYERFLYFLALPIIISLGIGISKIPNVLATLLSKKHLINRLKPTLKLSRKNATVLLISILIFVSLLTPLFSTRIVQDNSGTWMTAGAAQVGFFQVMNKQEYEAIQWAKSNTPQGSVFVADANFGWWISGFAQRPTLSAADPQYLILRHELEPAQVATNLLKADYIVNNGLIEIKQNSASTNGNVHEISLIPNNSYVHPTIFSINDSLASLIYRNNGVAQQVSLNQLPNAKTEIQNTTNAASFVITKENNLLSITEKITLYKGTTFPQVTFTLNGKTQGISFDWLHLPFQSQGFLIETNNSIAIVDNSLLTLNQFIFPQQQLGSDVLITQNPQAPIDLNFNLNGNQTAQANFFVGLYQFNPNSETSQSDYWYGLMNNYLKNYLTPTTDLPISYFDYQVAIKQWNISYVAIREQDQVIPRFSSDNTFSLVFKNDQVSIFKVVKNN